MMVMPYQWPRLTEAIQMPELMNDPRFDSPRQRRENKFDLQNIIEKWMKSIGCRDKILEILRKTRVPVAPVLTLQEAISHPHATKRGAIRHLDDPFIGKFPIPGQPPLFPSGHSKRLKAPHCEHNEECSQLFAEWKKKKYQNLSRMV